MLDPPLLIIRGIVGIIAGIVAVAWPGLKVAMPVGQRHLAAYAAA